MPCRSFVVVYMIWMLERICGTISAAIRPCRRRAPISISVERGETRQRRGDSEAGDADQEHLLVADDVAEPAAGDEEEREGELIAGDDPLDAGIAGIEARRGSTGSRR